MSEPKRIAVTGHKAPRHGVDAVWTWRPDGDLLGTVIYVHGMFDNADTAWKGTLGSFTSNKVYKRPGGAPLQDQFEQSGVQALFVVAEAEINSDNGSEVVWTDLQDLLRTAGAKGPVAALSHSAGYATVSRWLGDADLVHISLIDSMYGSRSKYEQWLKGDGHSIDLIGAGKTPRYHFEQMLKPWTKVTAQDKTPPRFLKRNSSDPDPLQAKVLWMPDPHDHMDLIAEGKVIPAVLKRAEAALLRAAGRPVPEAKQPPPAPEKKPAAAVFEAGSGKEEVRHVVDQLLESELRDVPDLARMAARHDLVLRPGSDRQDAVKAVHKALQKLVGAKLEGGKYDSETKRAMRDFQTRWNDRHVDDGKHPPLDADGLLGPKTLLALDEALLDSSFGGDACAAPPKPYEEKRWDLFKRAVEKSGAKFGDKAWQMNLLGIRGQVDGRAAPEGKQFNDTLAVAYKCGKGHRHVAEYLATVDPALMVDGEPDVHLEDGQYEYEVGNWQGKPCLKPKGHVRVWKDMAEDGIRQDADPTEEGEFPAMIAPAPPGDEVPDAGGGIQLIAGGDDEGSPWARFWKLIQLDDDKTYTYTLFDGASMPGIASVPRASPPPAAPTTPPGDTQLKTDGAKQVEGKPFGNFYVFSKATKVTNNKNRPKFLVPKGTVVEYTGPGSNARAVGAGYDRDNRLIHPVLVEPLTALMTALTQEGERLGDESMKRAVIGSGWRSPEQDGAGFLKQLKSQLDEKKAAYGNRTFPRSLETEAQSNLHDPAAQKAFIRHLGAETGWTVQLAQQLWNDSIGYKAPAGLSPHESGLVVDIDFPYAIDSGKAHWHDISRKRNADARRSAAGMWLAQYSGDFHFSSYNTEREIWHMEYLNWHGTEADPGDGT